MDLARAPRRAPLTARKKGSGYENGASPLARVSLGDVTEIKSVPRGLGTSLKALVNAGLKH